MNLAAFAKVLRACSRAAVDTEDAGPRPAQLSQRPQSWLMNGSSSWSSKKRMRQRSVVA